MVIIMIFVPGAFRALYKYVPDFDFDVENEFLDFLKGPALPTFFDLVFTNSIPDF